MFGFFSFWAAFNVLLSFRVQIGLAIVLEDWEPYRPSNGNSSLDLQSVETFFWAGQNNGSLGNLTVYMPGEHENIIALSNFRSMLKSIQCTNSSVTFTFSDNAAYDYAKNAWQWVNVEKNNTFVLIAGTGDCGWNSLRQPFVISTITFDDPDKQVNLQGNASTWKSVAHSYDLWVGSMPSRPSKFKSRDITQSLTIDFNHPLPASSWTFPLPDGASFQLDCANCGTHGSFDLSLDIHQYLDTVPDGASITITPKGVSASITPKLVLNANFTGSISDEVTVGKIPVDGITIPGPGEDILDIGPQIFFKWGYSIGPVKGSASVSAGIAVDIPDNSDVSIGIIPPGISATGWKPTVSHIPVTVTGQISAGIQDYAKIGVDLSIEALGNGFVASVYLKPFLGASLNLIESINGAACSNDPEKHPFGVSLSPSVGIDLDAELDEVVDDKTTTIANVVIASATLPLGSACFGFGPTDAAQAASLSSASAAKVSTAAKGATTADAAPTPTDSADSTCTNGAGTFGICISTSACSSQGGNSEAGYCPGAADIQCCTPVKCTNNAGAAGLCMTTSDCSAKKGTFEAGHCPGPANIECCVT